MSKYLCATEKYKALTITVICFSQGAHELWILFKETEEGRKIHHQQDLKSAPASIFEILNKEKVALNKLEKGKQLKYGVSFNEEFQRILFDILLISNYEKNTAVTAP